MGLMGLVRLVLLVVSLTRGRIVLPLLFFGSPYIVGLGMVAYVQSGGDAQSVRGIIPLMPALTYASLFGLLYTAVLPPNLTRTY
jgi:hypothetical protein